MLGDQAGPESAQEARQHPPVKSVLIANRGEIALRIIRACHEEGLEAVAVYSAADRAAPYVRAADRAVPIGPAPPSESYLVIDKLLDAAVGGGRRGGAPRLRVPGRAGGVRRGGGAGGARLRRPAGARHPRHGRQDRGPAPDAGRRACPIVPGASAPAHRPGERARAGAPRSAIPVMVKAAAGGGGKGMRVVRAEAELAGALADRGLRGAQGLRRSRRVSREVHRAPRHVEIQVLADHQQRTVHLGERECSVQRRHQKLVEEAPSVAVSPDAPGTDGRRRRGRGAGGRLPRAPAPASSSSAPTGRSTSSR